MEKLCTLITFLLLSIMSASSQSLNIIPEPVKIETSSAGYFILGNDIPILISDKQEQQTAQYLKNYLYQYYGIDVKIVKKAPRSSSQYIKLSSDPNISRPKGYYTIQSDAEVINISGAGPEGLFYGVQTLIQMFSPLPNRELKVPLVKIEDYPQFQYRGMHLDVVRHIFPVSFIKRYLDYLALHKLNYFHWHLTDDQGWRFESKKFPELNSVGSWRDGSIIGIFPGTGMDSTRYGGYYTQAEIKEIREYAKERFITIIPEIDIPGHSMATISVFPQFSTTPEIPKKPATTWGIYNRQNNVLAPSEEVFRFLEEIFGELLELFPDSPYIHIGGDECAHKWWKESESVQKFIAENNLGDERGLQKYFVERVYNIVKSKGRDVIAWDDIIDDGDLVGDIIVMSWRNEKGAVTAAKRGHRAIMTPMRKSYFNLKQQEKESRLSHRTTVISLQDVYEFNPLPDTLSASAKKLIMGGQACMWNEYFASEEEVEYAIFPRMSAMAECYWTPAEYKNWERFLEKMPDQYQRYKLWRVRFFDIFEQTK